MSENFIPKRPVVMAYPKMPEAFAETEAVAAYFKDQGLDAPRGSIYDEELRKGVKQGAFDMLVAVGGDGGVLRAGHLCAPYHVPILGINLGRVGFLIQVNRHEWREYLEKLLKGEAWIENRMMLHADHVRAGDAGGWNAERSGRRARREPAAGAAGRPVDGRLLTSYVADGLIAATVTLHRHALAAADRSCHLNCATSAGSIAPHLSVDWQVLASSSVSITVGVRTRS
jgi:NAD+ kinase